MHDGRDVGVCPDSHAGIGDCRAVGPRREPPADRRAALRGGARAGIGRRAGRPVRRTLGVEVGPDRVLFGPERGAAILDSFGAAAHDGASTRPDSQWPPRRCLASCRRSRPPDRTLHAQLRNLGSGGSTLRFGGVWSTAMIVQVALTVVAIPPAIGIAGEAVRDRMIRAQFPAGEYLAVPIELDRASGAADESEAAFAQRLERTYGELERRIAQQPGVVAVTFADRLPGMDVAVRGVEVEISAGSRADQRRQHVDGRRGSWFLRGIREADRDRPRVPLGRSRCRCADGDRERGVRPRARS